MKRHLIIALAVLSLALPGLILGAGCPPANDDSATKAAIVDQLAVMQLNQELIDQMTGELEACGFEVDVYSGEEVSVELYRRLPRHGYRLIIFRAHAGLLQAEEGSEVVGVMPGTYLFTAEEYQPTRYIHEQLDDQLLPAEMGGNLPLVFAINAKFIRESMAGRFDDTLIIMMGCSGAYLEDMSTAFILKGASTYVRWGGSVTLDYVDLAAANLITNLCSGGMTIEQAVAETMDEIGPDPVWDASLRYHPRENSGQTIAGLISGE